MTYNVILADPPWHFKVWNPESGSGRSAVRHYSTMGIEDIYRLPVNKLTDDNCALFLWATFPMLNQALGVIGWWGFTYRTIAWVWVKTNRKSPGYFTGMGYYTRSNTEPCLLAVKGNMPVAVHNELALIVSPVREHSQKPDEQYGKIERLYPDCRYLEMFARKQRPGWDVFGNEVENSIEMPL